MQEKSKGRAIPFKSDVPSEFPPMFKFWADGRDLGVGAKAEQPPVTKTEHKREMVADFVSTEKENPTQQLKTEQIPDRWETNEWDQNDWWSRMGYDWLDPSGWGKYRPTLPPKGNYAKGGKPSPMLSNLKVDHGGKAFADSECGVKINERSVSKPIPLLIEFSSYRERKIESQRWACVLYNRPVSLRIDYFVSNLTDRKTSRVDVEAGGLLKRELKSKLTNVKKQLRRGGV